MSKRLATGSQELEVWFVREGALGMASLPPDPVKVTGCLAGDWTSLIGVIAPILISPHTSCSQRPAFQLHSHGLN